MSNRRIASQGNNDHCPIVCIGASAGGLEALISLFKALPGNVNMAFVLIQHLEPQHKSALVEILSRETSLNIREAKNNAKIEPAHIYVIPPNTLLTVSRRRLKITRRVKRPDGKNLPVDSFMVSLAEDQREKAVGIVLSGTGSDGTQGLKAIKARGGITFTQDEKTARYFGMPGSAQASGSVDFVSEPQEIAKKLIAIAAQRVKTLFQRARNFHAKKDGLTMILVLLRDLTGVDFSHYKLTTVSRRIARRMAFHSLKNHNEYYDYLKKNPSEAHLLFKDILISVTGFFRDPEVFAALGKKIFPLIVKNRSPKDSVRIWVPACSSGEEVYSLAIAFYEFLETKKIKPYLQIFGTDLSDTLIARARSGVYGEDISLHVSAERLRRFFIKTESGYKIAKHIRDLCIFARHDITNDPPLSNMDLESCRNLLIYLDVFLQNKALLMLHYALKPKGFLVLGSAESTTALPRAFDTCDKKNKIYTKNIVPRRPMAAMMPPKARELVPTESKRAAIKKKGPLQGEGMPFTLAQTKKARVKKRFMPKVSASVKAFSKGAGEDISRLRKEFKQMAERLNAVSEEKDTFNEELRSANEEIQSSNEELQSMNEELETSKEELQSTNEELMTLNEELQNKNAELSNLNSDLTNVFSSTNVPMIIVGNDLRIKRFTPTARKVMNLIPSDIDRPLGDIKLNVDITDLEEMIRNVIEDMVPKESEVKDKDGRWYSVRIRPYRTLDNKIDGAVISLIDIDAIKQTREKMQSSLDYTQAIIETMREPLLVLDKDARILSANKSFYDMFKVRALEVENKPFYEFNGYKWNSPQLRKLLGEILPKKAQFSGFEASFEIPGIGPRIMVLNGRQITMLGEDKPMILIVMEDITKRKKAEDILKRDSESLEKLVRARSRELLELEVRLERAKHLSAIGTLAATVAHELRNTLTAIGAAAYRMRNKVQDPQVRGSLSNIDKKIAEGAQIINNVLEYSKIKTSNFEKVKINDVLEFCLAEVKERVATQGISVRARIGRTRELLIDIDHVQIKEVFSNILNNAVDAIDKDSGIIYIESRCSGSTVDVVIKDNGEGIEKKDLGKVSEPFFTTKAKGTGLGLAVCKQVLMLHDGFLSIESEKGKGTKVRVTLPIRRNRNA